MLSHGMAPCRMTRGVASVTSMIVDGGPPGVTPASSSTSRPAPSDSATVVRIVGRRLAALVRARRGQRRAAGRAQRAGHRMRRHAHADAARSAGHVSWQPLRRLHQHGQWAGPEADRQEASQHRQHAERGRDLVDVSRHKRDRPIGRPRLEPADRGERFRVERVHGESIERIGRHGDDPAGPDGARRRLRWRRGRERSDRSTVASR